jgi:hypothetical protein
MSTCFRAIISENNPTGRSMAYKGLREVADLYNLIVIGTTPYVGHLNTISTFRQRV